MKPIPCLPILKIYPWCMEALYITLIGFHVINHLLTTEILQDSIQ